MPGITGIISKRKADGMQLSGRIDRMTEAMVHEASYLTGTYKNVDLGVYLGWACLEQAFAKAQPIWNEARDILLILHGEVFTDPGELARFRSRKGAGDADKATYIVQLYEEQGHDWLLHLNGFFSGLIVDLRKGDAILFNDRFGMQRIYLRETDDEFLFASEAKSLLAASPELRELSTDSLAEGFVLGCVLEQRTLFKQVRQLPGASSWTFGRGGQIRKETYFGRTSWENQAEVEPEAFAEELREVLGRILPMYLQSDYPVGMSLTGGLDTRLIMALCQPPRSELPCYTFASRYRDSYDVRIARKVAGVCHQSYQPIRLGGEFLARFAELAAKSVYISDGNFGVSGAAELYANQLAREIAPVRLTGNYGSEIMRGDGEFRPRKMNLGLFCPEFQAKAGEAVRRFGSLESCSGVSFAAFRQAPWFNYSRLSLEQSKLRVRTPFMDNKLVALMYRAPRGLARTNELSFGLIRNGNPKLASIPTDRGERIAGNRFLSSLETRWHWLLKRAELCFDYGMPQKVAPVDRVLRHFHLEKLFLGRFGFLHFRTWFRTELAPYLAEILLDERTLSRPILNRVAVATAVKEHISGKRNHTLDLERLLTYELTERQFVEARN